MTVHHGDGEDALFTPQGGGQYGPTLRHPGDVAQGAAERPTSSSPDSGRTHRRDARGGDANGALATILKQERRAVPLVAKDGKLQIEQFLSHVSQWRRRHQIILGNRPSEQVMQEWLLTQV